MGFLTFMLTVRFSESVPTGLPVESPAVQACVGRNLVTLGSEIVTPSPSVRSGGVFIAIRRRHVS
jgi:hypothetical protein